MPEIDLLPVSLDEFKKHLTDGPGADMGEDDDDELTRALAAAMHLIEKRIGPLVTREFIEDVKVSRSSHHRYGERYTGRLLLSKRPAVALVEVVAIIYGTATPIDGFDPSAHYLDKEAAILDLRGWTSRCFDYRVTYTAGRGTADEIDSDYKEAVLITGEHLWETQRGRGLHPSRWGTQADQEAVPEIMRGFALPRRAQELIALDEQVVFG